MSRRHYAPGAGRQIPCRKPQRFAAAQGQHGAVVADAFEPVVGEGGEAGAYLLDKSEFGHVYFVLLRAKVPKFAENSYLRLRAPAT